MGRQHRSDRASVAGRVADGRRGVLEERSARRKHRADRASVVGRVPVSPVSLPPSLCLPSSLGLRLLSSLGLRLLSSLGLRSRLPLALPSSLVLPPSLSLPSPLSLVVSSPAARSATASVGVGPVVVGAGRSGGGSVTGGGGGGTDVVAAVVAGDAAGAVVSGGVGATVVVRDVAGGASAGVVGGDAAAGVLGGAVVAGDVSGLVATGVTMSGRGRSTSAVNTSSALGTHPIVGPGVSDSTSSTPPTAAGPSLSPILSLAATRSGSPTASSITAPSPSPSAADRSSRSSIDVPACHGVMNITVAAIQTTETTATNGHFHHLPPFLLRRAIGHSSDLRSFGWGHERGARPRATATVTGPPAVETGFQARLVDPPARSRRRPTADVDRPSSDAVDAADEPVGAQV